MRVYKITGKIPHTLMVSTPSDRIMNDHCFSFIDYIMYWKLNKYYIFANMWKGDCRHKKSNDLLEEERLLPTGGTRESYRDDVTHEMNPKVYTGFGQHGQQGHF